MDANLILSIHTSPFDQPGVGNAGGMNVYVRNLAASLARNYSNSHVITINFSGASFSKQIEPGMTLHSVSIGSKITKSIKELYQMIDKVNALIYQKVLELTEKGVNFRVIHANYWLSGVIGHYLKHELNIALATTFHSIYSAWLSRGLAGIKERYKQEVMIAKCSDVIFASSEHEATSLCEDLGIERNRIEILTPGIDSAYFMPGAKAKAKEAVGFKGDDKIILFAGRIQELKGVHKLPYIIEELKKTFKNLRLIVAGGPSGEEGKVTFDNLVRAFNEPVFKDSVYFVGPRSHEDLSSYYRSADLVIMPSESESFGFVALEAQACATPVVGSRVGGLSYLIKDGQTGFLCEPSNIGEFVYKSELILGDQELAVRLGRNANLWAGQFSWSRSAKKFQSLVEILNAKELVQCP